MYKYGDSCQRSLIGTKLGENFDAANIIQN